MKAAAVGLSEEATRVQGDKGSGKGLSRRFRLPTSRSISL